MRILLLSMYYKPDTAATGLLMAEIVEELTVMGHEVTVVTSMPHYTTNSVWPEYRGKLGVQEKINGVDIRRVYSFVPKHKDKLLGRFVSYFTFLVFSTLAALRTGKQDIILIPSPSPPLVNGLSAWFLSKARRIPFVSNIQDIYPDVGIRLGLLKNRHAISGYQALENFVYRRSHAITVISDGFSKNLQDKKVPPDKLTVIPNFIDSDFVRPLNRFNSFSEEHGLHDRFVALFAGNVGLSQGLENVLEAASMLKERPEILFLIVGNGAAKASLMERAAAMGLENVRFLPYQPYERVPEVYSASDVCLVPLRRGLTEDSVPSKVFTIMGVARPLIASVDASSDTARVINDSRSGICVEPEDAQEMKEAILQLFHDRERAVRMGERGRLYVEENYTRTQVARQYHDLFARLTGKAEAVVQVARQPALNGNGKSGTPRTARPEETVTPSTSAVKASKGA